MAWLVGKWATYHTNKGFHGQDRIDHRILVTLGGVAGEEWMKQGEFFKFGEACKSPPFCDYTRMQ